LNKKNLRKIKNYKREKGGYKKKPVLGVGIIYNRIDQEKKQYTRK